MKILQIALWQKNRSKMGVVELGRFRVICFGLFLLLLFFSPDVEGQRKKSKHTKAFYKSRYTPAKKADKQCFQLFKKKYSKPKHKDNQSFLASLFGTPKAKSKPMAEVDPNDTPPPPVKPQPIAKKEPEKKPSTENNTKEDQVLELKNIPEPTSAKHEEIRKKVERNLQTHKDGEPIELEPLYFIFDDAEFSVVDMEPFLIAVEYALQGRMVLIEGHTDSYGKDDYNVKLSIQRVEKIRQLMLDMGVPDERISVVGYGEEKSVFDNTTKEGRQKNRRVDFKVF
ncbi:OmpA family protein [Fulvivirga sp. 29W222]|uniref:OmpA family protein n=1 Tax=Fulvivirga marina TaxID=2494733 RepID=A0A937FT64_9BACT|nr:OmpA family protein [Fulvivirga marina]MBL6445049.1 OmpA family protein [Fulvivirga marina]